MMALTSVTKNLFKTAIFLASLRYMLETIGIEQDPSPIYGIITVNISFFIFKAIVTSLISSHRERFTHCTDLVKNTQEKESEYVVAASDLLEFTNHTPR